MPRLRPQELRARLRYDSEVMGGLGRDGLGAVRAFASAQDLRRGREVTPEEAQRGRAKFYSVEITFTHLVGGGRTANSSTVVFDLLSGGNYPFTSPQAHFVTRPLPLSPHVHPGNGWVCLGNGWARAGGKMLMAQLTVHVMRLVNFDEPGHHIDMGFNPEAARYWRDVLGRRPYLPDLSYPRLPSELTHGVNVEAEDIFVPANSGFRPVGVRDRSRANDSVFLPVTRRF